jgi:hypothetical protein
MSGKFMFPVHLIALMKNSSPLNVLYFCFWQVVMMGLVSYGEIYAQCACPVIKRDDGANIVQCNPLPVAYNNETQVGLAIASNGEDNFITVTVRFKDYAQKLIGTLSIRLEDDHQFTFGLVNSGLSQIGDSYVSQAVYVLDQSALQKLSISRVKTISITFADEIMRTYNAVNNRDVLISQLRCL